MPKHRCREWRDGIRCRYAHAKLDGIFLRVTSERVETSLPTDITRHAPMIPGLAGVDLPTDVTVLGELYCPGRPASEVKSCLARERHLELQFSAFAIETHPEDLELDRVDWWCRRWGMALAPWITLPGYVEPSLLGYVVPDQEGWVLKNGNLGEWYKWKPVMTCDCVVTGSEDGNGKYLGLLGALRLAVYDATGQLVEVARASGMSDAERVQMTEDDLTGRLVGRVCEVSFQYVGSKGRLRHPRFVRWRDDEKRPEECTLEQLS
jgi:ATP-dependent DNA ligase